MEKGIGFHWKNSFVDISIRYIWVLIENDGGLDKPLSFSDYNHLTEYQILLQHKTVLGIQI